MEGSSLITYENLINILEKKYKKHKDNEYIIGKNKYTGQKFLLLVLKVDDLKEISKEIKTQDNMITANQIFILFDHELVPTDSDYSDEILYCWNGFGDWCEIGTTKESVIAVFRGCHDTAYWPNLLGRL